MNHEEQEGNDSLTFIPDRTVTDHIIKIEVDATPNFPSGKGDSYQDG